MALRSTSFCRSLTDWLRYLCIGALGCASNASSVRAGLPNDEATRPAGPTPGVPLELRLERALPLDVRDVFEPSGLALLDGRLLTVSDKHDSSVFELVLHETIAAVHEYCSFEPPIGEPRPFDFEAISAARDGSLLLASEARFRVLEIDSESRAVWKIASVQSKGLEQGLFQRHNAGLEGLARLPGGQLLLAVEREPRGLVEISKDGDPRKTRAWAVPDSIYPMPGGRPTDFSDLAVYEDQLYALERSAHLVVRLERSAGGFREREAWSFRDTEVDARFAYRDQTFGRAEGLAIDASHVYIVLDNNGDTREAVADRRPLLFVFQRPKTGARPPAAVLGSAALPRR